MRVIKRDGSIVDFNLSKIGTAVSKTFFALDKNVRKDEIEKIENLVKSKIKSDLISIEEIQDLVEDTLLELDYEDVFKEYVTYRRKRALSREFLSDNHHSFLKKIESIGIVPTKYYDFIEGNEDLEKNTAMAQMLQYSSTLSKEFTTGYLLDNKTNNAIFDGDFYIHDLEYYPMATTSSSQIDLNKLFKNALNINFLNIREAKDITSYANLAAMVLQLNQNDQHGSQSIPLFDFYMAKGVLKSFKLHYLNIIEDDFLINQTIDSEKLAVSKNKINQLNDLSQIKIDNSNYDKQIYNLAIKKVENETFKAMKVFILRLNSTVLKAGAKRACTNINFGTDISKAGRVVSKFYLLALKDSFNDKHKNIMPNSIFKIKDGINYKENDPNYDLLDLACETAFKTKQLNFSFIDAPFNLDLYNENKVETEVAYIQNGICNSFDINSHNIFKVPSRGNLSLTTINLVRLGIKHGIFTNNQIMEEDFFQDLKTQLNLIKDQLMKRFNYQASKKAENFPFLLGQKIWENQDNTNTETNLEDVLKHGSLSIGFIGLAETLIALTGKHHGESEKAQSLGIKIISYMRTMVDSFTKEENLNFNLCGTSNQKLAKHFVDLDRSKYGKIEAITQLKAYTNSFHIPLYYQTSFEKIINKEAAYHTLANGGHNSYLQRNDTKIINKENLLERLKIMHNLGIGYSEFYKNWFNY